MKKNRLIKVVCALATLLAAGVTSAGTLDGSTTKPPTTTLTAANQIVVVEHIFSVGYYNNETFSCGIKVESSDRSPAKNYSLTKSTTLKQFIEKRSYHLPGTYAVTASGFAWGGMVACLGSQTSTTTILPMEAVKIVPLAAPLATVLPPEAPKYTTVAAPLAAILPPEAGKIMSITTPQPAVVAETTDGIVVPFTINGKGTACTLQVYPHNQQDPQPVMVNVEKFPVTVMIKFPHKPDDYKMLAWGTGQKACDSTAEANLKVRIKLAIPKMPTITGLFLAPVVSHNAEAWRQDEAVDFYVAGNLKNNDDPTLQCGWTLFMNGIGQSKVVTTGSKFTMGQIIPATFFSAFEPGDYTMRVKSSGADDTKANQDCKGEASQKFKLLRATATIKAVVLKAFAYHYYAGNSSGDPTPGSGEGRYPQFCNNCGNIFSPAHDIGLLRITPIFVKGQICSYSITQKFNGKQTKSAVIYTPDNAMGGISADAPPRLNVYSDDKTTVTVTVLGTAGPGGPCEGSATNTITVYDDLTLPAVTK